MSDHEIYAALFGAAMGALGMILVVEWMQATVAGIDDVTDNDTTAAN